MKDEIKSTIDVYDRFSEQFANHTDVMIPQFYLNKFISYLDGKKILDVGCGPGRDVRYFLDEGMKPYGVDLSSGLLKEAKKRGKGNYLQMNMMKLGFKDKSFDGIWSLSSVLHIKKKDAIWSLSSVLHIKKKDASIAAKEFSRVLKKGGVLFLGLKEGQGEIMKESPTIPGAKRFYAFYEMHEAEELLRENGFEILSAVIEKGAQQGINNIDIFARKI